MNFLCECVFSLAIGIASMLFGAFQHRLKKLRDPYPHRLTPSITTMEVAIDGAIGGLFGAGVGLFTGYVLGMTFFSVYQLDKWAEVEMIVWMTLIAVLAWLLGGSIGGLLADRWIMENDYPRKRSSLALGGFFTAFTICIASSIFMGIVNTLAVL